MAKVDVTQRVYKSGRLKDFLNPFSPVSAEVDQKARHLVESLGQVFVNDVQTIRGNRLKAGVDFGTGEPWAALEAKELGLIDAIGTLDDVVQQSWSLDAYDFNPRPTGLSSLGASLTGIFTTLAVHDPLQHQIRLR